MCVELPAEVGLAAANAAAQINAALGMQCEMCDRPWTVTIKLGPDANDPDSSELYVKSCDVCHEEIQALILTEELVAEGLL